MHLALVIIFANPLVLAAVDWYLWHIFGWPGLVAALAAPVGVWLTMDETSKRRSSWSYIAGMQLFYASTIAGMWTILDGGQSGNMLVVGAGVLLLIPALVLATLVLIAS